MLFTQFVTATVTDVYVSGSHWTQAFKDYLAARHPGSSAQYGLAITEGYRQSDILPWANIDQVTVRFNEPMTLRADHLRLRGGAVQQYDLATFNSREEPNTSINSPFGYDTVATWTLPRPLGNDKLLLEVEGDAPGGATGPYGDLLDGDHDGTPGGDYRLRFNVLPGDTNSDGIIVPQELVAVRARLFKSLLSAGTGPYTYEDSIDLDGNGSIDARDLLFVRRQRLYTYLESREPTPGSPSALPGLFSEQRIVESISAAILLPS